MADPAGQNGPIEYDRQVNFTMKVVGSGSVRPMEDKPRGKCRKWQLRARTGLNPRTGKYGEKTRIFYGTYRQSLAALNDFIEEIENLKSSAPGRKLTFQQLSDEWIAHRLAMGQISHGTELKNRTSLRALCWHIGQAKASKIEPYMITDAMKALMSGDSPSGRKLSGSTVRTVIITANYMYKSYAIPNALAEYNPFEQVELPKDDTKERKPLTDEQQAQLMQMCPPTDHHYVAVALALYGGLRRGEIISLLWGDVDLLDGIIMLPNTKGGRDLIPIPISHKLTSYLLEWKERQQRRMYGFEVTQTDKTHVCANELGDILSGSTLGHWWSDHRDGFGCQGVHLHDLRHTFATNLARKNVHPKAIQGLLRHKDEKLSLRVYTHVNTEQMREAVSFLE